MIHRISLLTNYEDASSYLDWTIGVHGIYISFPHPSTLTPSSESSSAPSPFSSSVSLPTRRTLRQTTDLSQITPGQTYTATYLRQVTSGQTYTATYLPQIAPEQGWDKIETIDSAIRKAGWEGRITEDIRRSVKLRRYQSRKCTVGWEEYVAWRTANGGQM